ncbi:hypothetical protein [Luteolibacter soli]|uniref:Right handed beta helix domain-containing protein n=1 Tax=Luteolibacter soli TaxID=3135280 RepID=A0ABU9ATP4_9BACT
MKTIALLPFAALITTTSVHAQGPLTPPPGAPAPLMKSLDQVEARTPLVAGQAGVTIDANGGITISQSGSYYLTGNLTLTTPGVNGITISTSHVTLDLNGFTLTNVTGSGGNAVLITAGNVTVRNGMIRGGTTLSGSTFTAAGWNDGITATTPYPNLVVEGVEVSGVRNNGIYLCYEGTRIERCSVTTVGATGLFASLVSSSTARKTGAIAILASSDPSSAAVSDCFAETVSPTQEGISASDGAVSNSRGIAVGGPGISAETATNCYGTSGSGTGLIANVATCCHGVSISGVGITGITLMNCYGQSVTGSFGISGTMATSCVASRAGGVALSVVTANGCHTLSGTVTATNKYNMP